MHSTHVSARIEPGQEEEAGRSLLADVLPTVKATPGLVAAYWFAPSGGVGFSVALWDTEQAATAVASGLQPGTTPAPGVTIETIEVREVVASI